MKSYYKNISEFIRALKSAGELRVITQPVSPYLEISKIADAESKSPGGGKALLFENAEGSPFPVAINLFGSSERICMALGVDHLDQLGERVRYFMELSPPGNIRDILGLLQTGISVSRFFPRQSRSHLPPCQEVVHTGDDVDLSKLPVLHCWPKDAGPFVTLPLVFTKSLKTGRQNVGMYRLQVFDKNTTGMHWHIHKDGAHFYQEYVRAKQRMPVAVAIGADPAVIYAATAPMPRNLDEMILAGFIRNKPVSMTRCVTSDVKVPAEAEFVLEGYVDPGELRREGPFGDHTGYYSLADDYPVFHVTAITHRKSPVYCTTLVGPPPMEDCYLAKATERLFLPMLQSVMPEILDYWFPWEGVFHNIVVVSIDKEFPGHAQKIMSGLWGQGQMSFCKTIVVVDKNINPQAPDAVMSRLLSTLDVSSDITLTRGILDVLDHSSPIPNFGAKLGIDLTDRFPGEPERTCPPELPCFSVSEKELLTAIQNQADGVAACRFFSFHDTDPSGTCQNRILMLAVEKGQDRGGAYFAECLRETDLLKPFNIILLYDAKINLEKNSLILWKLFNNADPDRDMFFQGNYVVIDACQKGPMDGHLREWPEELTFQ
ncbi:menaquinone biosynthesis decarboxylase [Desulfonema magnum]|uniref:Decarboxylase family protein, UbiD-like n=1 Tax=Desulfonema magnum TaxID=45655 RepID=A0A975BQ56_9BACT|nr:menaquinone biosynthesis decarboxylase [Desulfonema magnum]QTA89020.1 Decarboxylase family protein, UbiD-like [Desulfonema magnum]